MLVVEFCGGVTATTGAAVRIPSPVKGGTLMSWWLGGHGWDP